MCWRFVRSVLIGAVSAAVGCARPAGELFPQTGPVRVWPASPDPPRIRLVGSLSGSDDLHAAQSSGEVLAALLRGPRPPIRFLKPLAIAVGEDRLVAIADGSASAVHLVDLRAREHTLVSGFRGERFGVPAGVAWAHGRLFVSDAQRHEIIELGTTGRFAGRFGESELIRPVGIAFARRSGELYVVDGGAHRLVVFDLRGVMQRTIGVRGDRPGEFNFPSHLAVRDDRVVVADSGNFRVQVLDLDGAIVRTIGQKGNGAGDFALPKGVAMDKSGRIFVADAQFENVQIFDSDGDLLMAFGREGRGAGEFWLPAGLAVDGRDRIWVADSGNRRIQLFSQVRASS